jgi:GDP-fucose transporter C1
VLPLTIAVSCAHTRTSPTKKVVVASGIVTIGFMLGVAPSKDLPVKAIPSTLSLVYGVLSAFFIAIHAVLIKSSLPHCNNSTIQLAWWTNAGSAVMILPFVFFHGEPWKLMELYTSGTWDPRVFVWGSLVTGVFGFLLCISGLLSIKVTSPITHMFSSVRALLAFFLDYFLRHFMPQAARSVLQTLIGVWAFGDILTVYVLCVCVVEAHPSAHTISSSLHVTVTAGLRSASFWVVRCAFEVPFPHPGPALTLIAGSILG